MTVKWIVIDQGGIVKFFIMRYPERTIMTETAIRPTSTVTEASEDPKLAEYTRQIFQEIFKIVPGLTSEQQHAFFEYAQQQAIIKLEYEKRIEQAEREIAKLQEEADRDPYNVEIYSEVGWYRIMKDKLAELKRNNQDAVIITLDLDHFKEYNDLTYDGAVDNHHVAGDIALGLAGQLIKSSLRAGDIVARLHGDEFIVVLPNTVLEGGVITAERIRQAIPQMQRLLNTPIEFSASIGVATLGQELIQTDFTTDVELIKALRHSYSIVDGAMYAGAKNAGKNRIGVMKDGKVQTAIINPGINNQPPTITYHTPGKL